MLTVVFQIIFSAFAVIGLYTLIAVIVSHMKPHGDYIIAYSADESEYDVTQMKLKRAQIAFDLDRRISSCPVIILEKADEERAEYFEKRGYPVYIRFGGDESAEDKT